MGEEFDQAVVAGHEEGDGWWGHLDEATAATLFETARQRNADLVQRLQAVETRAGSLLVFAGVIAGLLVGRGVASMSVAGAVAVLFAVAAAGLGATVGSCAAIGFWWPEPRASSMALHDSGEMPQDALLEEEVIRGEHNHRTIRAREVWLRAAASLLVLSLMLAAVDWGGTAIGTTEADCDRPPPAAASRGPGGIAGPGAAPADDLSNSECADG